MCLARLIHCVLLRKQQQDEAPGCVRDHLGRSPLWIAAFYGNQRQVEYLLQHGANRSQVAVPLCRATSGSGVVGGPCLCVCTPAVVRASCSSAEVHDSVHTCLVAGVKSGTVGFVSRVVSLAYGAQVCSMHSVRLFLVTPFLFDGARTPRTRHTHTTRAKSYATAAAPSSHHRVPHRHMVGLCLGGGACRTARPAKGGGGCMAQPTNITFAGAPQ
jgi:hypothetical protein